MITKEEFKQRWESDDLGGGITYQDLEDCYTNWKLGANPRKKLISKVIYQVLKAANTIDAEDYNPNRERKEKEEE